jgi:hypothetical protein
MGLSVIMLAYPAASCGECACNRFHKTTDGRIQTDPRINLMGERVDRVWADPILILRKDIVR